MTPTDPRPHLFLAVLCLVAALAALRRQRPLLLVVLLFAASELLDVAARLLEEPELLLVAGGFLLPIPFALPGRLRRRGALLIGIAGALLCWRGIVRAESPALRPKPVVTAYWRAGDPLRASTVPLLLRPRPHVARVLDHQGRIFFEWPAQAGRGEVDVVLENAGPAEAYQLVRGRASVTSLGSSKLRLTCRFGNEGERVEWVGKPWRSPSRVLLLGQARGDLPALRRLLDQVREDPPDLIVLLGDMVRRGDHPGLLAVRDLVDALGTRVQSVPGDGERGPFGVRTHDALFGSSQALRQSAGLALLLLDSSAGLRADPVSQGLGFRARLGTRLGTGFLCLHDPLLSRAGEEGQARPTGPVAEEILERLREWEFPFTASSTEGASYRIARNGGAHFVVGGPDDRLEAYLLRVEEGRVSRARVLKQTRSGAIEKNVLGRWLRWRSLTKEHWETGARILYGAALLVAALLVLLARVIPGRRRNEDGG